MVSSGGFFADDIKAKIFVISSALRQREARRRECTIWNELLQELFVVLVDGIA